MAIVSSLRGIGTRVVNGVWRIGYATRFFLMTLLYSGASFRRFHLTVKEMFSSGVMSLIIILVAGMFVGMVLGLQGYETLKRYGSESALGTLVALSLVRELGPVLAALLFASRAGSAMTAEIGLMKATEQISAMEMMAVNPIARVVAPRFWGGVISLPLLTAMFSAMGVFGGYVVGVVLIGVDEGSFWSQMQAAVDFQHDVLNGVIKSFVFGVAVTVIALFEGYDAPPTAEGVSGATTRTVVQSSLAILVLDFVLTAFMFRGDEHGTDHAGFMGRHVRCGGDRGAGGAGAQGGKPEHLQRVGIVSIAGVFLQYRRPETQGVNQERRSAGRAGDGDQSGHRAL